MSGHAQFQSTAILAIECTDVRLGTAQTTHKTPEKICETQTERTKEELSLIGKVAETGISDPDILGLKAILMFAKQINFV